MPLSSLAARLLTATASVLAVAAAAPAAAADVGVSIGIEQPGVYGRIDIGRFPQPQVIVQQPVVVLRQVQPAQPVYLHVPPGHRKKWHRHCRDYGACGVPVYFVQERWYQDHVARAPMPVRGDRGHGGHRGEGHGHGRGHGRD